MQTLPGCWCPVGSQTAPDVLIQKLRFFVNVAYQNTVCVCGVRFVQVVRREWLCAGRFYSLCVSSFSLSPPPRHCVLHQPPSIPQSFEKVGALFSLLLLLLCFRKRHLLKQQEPRKKKKEKNISFKSETFKPCFQK